MFCVLASDPKRVDPPRGSAIQQARLWGCRACAPRRPAWRFRLAYAAEPVGGITKYGTRVSIRGFLRPGRSTHGPTLRRTA